MTDDEIRAEYVAAMGSELGNLQHDLQSDLAWLLRKWSEFGELFKDEDSRISLLNQVASNFFYFLQCWFYEDAMLHISRLSDPPETGRSKQPNLTIMRLPRAISDVALKAKVEVAVLEARDRCEFARTWRNKRLAHADLTVLRCGVASALPQVRRTDIQEASAALCVPVRIVNDHFGKQSLFFTISDPWGVRSLLYHLEQSVARKPCSRARETA